MARWRRSGNPQRSPLHDRAWSARTNVKPHATGAELVGYSPLPAETGPTWAPDRLSIWPVEGGQFGIDAHYHGKTGAARAEHQRQRLAAAGLRTSIRPDEDEGRVLRLGPLAHAAVWLALEGFLGRPVQHDDGPVDTGG